MFAKVVAKLFGRAPRTPIHNAHRFRPQVEGLETRDVPASYYWHPTSGISATNPDNWWVEPGGGHAVPGAGADVYFQNTHAGSNADCEDFGGATYHSVSLIGVNENTFMPYTGTITLASSFTTQILDVESGTIDQPDKQPENATDITVTGLFNWTGGTLNSDAHVAEVTLDGATGTIAPLSEGTVYLGSNLSIVNSAVLTMYAGTIECVNDALEFTATNQGAVNVNPGTGKQTIVTPTPGLNYTGILFELNNTTSLDVQSGIYLFRGIGINNGGRFTLWADTTAELPGLTAGATWSYRQSSGQTQLYGHSKLIAAKSMIVEGGTLATKFADNISQGDASIDTPFLEISGGDIYINQGGTNHNFGTLSIGGDIEWTGGTYHPFVREFAGTAVASDLWQSTGTFTIGGTSALAPTDIDIFGDTIMPPTSGLEWMIFNAFFQIVNANGTPDYDDVTWDLDMRGNPRLKQGWLVAN